jgi:hypothetical protein
MRHAASGGLEGPHHVKPPDGKGPRDRDGLEGCGRLVAALAEALATLAFEDVAPRLRETGTPRIPAQRSSLLEYGTAWHRTNQLFITNNTGTKVLKARRLQGHGDTSPAQIALC